MKRGRFEEVAERAAKIAGSPFTFGVLCLLLVVWFASGPWFHWSDQWQLIVNTPTTIITTLMTLLIQNSQNRGDKAIAVKLDELIRSNEKARNELIGLEKKTEQDIAQAAEEVQKAVEQEAVPAIEPYYLRRLSRRGKR